MKGLITKMGVMTTFKHISRQTSRIECGRQFHAAGPATEKAFASSSDPKTLLAAVRAVHKVCIHIINSGDLRPEKKSNTVTDKADTNKETIYRTWIRERYADCCRHLCDLLSHENSAVQELSLCTLMRFVKTNSVAAVNLLKHIVGALLQSDVDLTSLIPRFQEFTEYDDVRYFTLKFAAALMKRQSSNADRQEVNVDNAFMLLKNLNMPENTDEDQLSKMYALEADVSESHKMTSLKEHKKVFQELWLEFLKKKLSSGLYHKVLAVLHDDVMPHMTNPLQLSDFLVESYNIGGATSLLALNGLFVLIHGYNLDFPEFYTKLYALLKPGIFHVKYKARFFYLLDLFLTSTHLPAYLVAAFVKRLSRISLTAPPDGLTIVLPLIFNLLRRHDACLVLVHRTDRSETTSDPYDATEPDPSKCHALDSSLWEVKSFIQHYHHSIANEAKKMEMGLSKQETDLSDVLSTTVADLISKEMKKKLTGVATTFEPPTSLFSPKDSHINRLWKF